MKKYLLSIVLALTASAAFSQTLKISGGISSATAGSVSKFIHLDRPIVEGTASVGIDYLEHDKWELSSEIGYVKFGGRTKDIEVLNIAEGKSDHPYFSESYNYIQANTTFRIKKRTENKKYYVGIGPAVNYLLKHTTELYGSGVQTILDGYEDNKISVGIKPEAGFYYYFNSRWAAGLNLSYNFGLTQLAKSEYTNLSGRTWLLQLNVGYSL
jgi:hypothetical protein